MTTSLDHRILDILRHHARSTVQDIASQLNESTERVSQAIQQLEPNGIILQYATIIDDSKLTRRKPPIRALIEVKVRPERRTGFDAVAARIAKFPNVVDHYLISGSYDFLVMVEGDSLEDISRFVSGKLATIEHVLSTATHFIMKKYKEKGAIVGPHDGDHRLMITP